MFKYDIGISYASEQEEIAARLYETLSGKGLNVYWSEKNSEYFITKSLYHTITDIYEKECKFIVTIISNEYTRKDYTRQELSVAKERVRQGDNCLIPIYTEDCQNRLSVGTLYYFVLSKQHTVYEIANRIYNFVLNSVNNDANNSRNFCKEQINIHIPREYQIFISGATGVGKSTIARKLLSAIPQFVIIEEADMLREAIRGENDRIVEQIVGYFQEIEGISKASLRQLLKYDILKKSTIDLEYTEINEQCNLILGPLEKVCFRLMDKGMPAIIEGVNLSFEAMLTNEELSYSTFLGENEKLFLNFYLSDEDEHKQRLKQRSEERREDYQTRQRYIKNLANIRRTNHIMYEKTQEYAKKYNNVYNIDTSGSIEAVMKNILQIIENQNNGTKM